MSTLQSVPSARQQSQGTIVNRQQSLSDFTAALEAAGLLVRIKEEKRVDQLPLLMEKYPTKAVLVEKITGCEFSFLANAYATHEQFAFALGCKRNEIGDRIAELAKGRIKPKIVTTAPCKEVILKGADVDLSRLPLFLHHDRDGHAYTSDNLVVTKDPDTNVIDWGIYRSMFRTINEKNFDMTCTSHRGRLNGLKYQVRGQNMPVAIVLGGPTLDKLAALAGVPPETPDYEVLGSFYGHPARLIKCETNDLLVPANAEIVLEGEVLTAEGWVHDEGPYGEFTGMYGGGIKHNPRVIIHCMTYRKGGIAASTCSTCAARRPASPTSPMPRSSRRVAATRSRRSPSCSLARNRAYRKSPWCSTTTSTSGTTAGSRNAWRSATCRTATLSSFPNATPCRPIRRSATSTSHSTLRKSGWTARSRLWATGTVTISTGRLRST